MLISHWAFLGLHIRNLFVCTISDQWIPKCKPLSLQQFPMPLHTCIAKEIIARIPQVWKKVVATLFDEVNLLPKHDWYLIGRTPSYKNPTRICYVFVDLRSIMYGRFHLVQKTTSTINTCPIDVQ